MLFTKPDAVWKNVLHHAPANARAYNNLGCCLLAAGDLEGALATFRGAIELAPGAPEPYINTGRILLKRNDPPGAAAILRQGLAAAPASDMLHDDLGLILEYQGKADEAAVQYRLALKYNARFGRSYYHLGRLLQRREDWKGAIPRLRAALAINPLDVPCSFWLALAYQRGGQFPQAIQQYCHTLELAPAVKQARRNIELCREGNRDGDMLPDELKMLKARLLQP
jgi:Flp pilus assembly protein TadD